VSAVSASPAAKGSPVAGDPVRALRHALYRAAKADPGRRFHALYDKISRGDVLWRAWVTVRRNNGAPGIDKVTLAAVEEYGVTRLLDELASELREGRYRPLPAPCQESSSPPIPSRTGGSSRMPPVNRAGEPCAGEPHARFDAAGAGNGAPGHGHRSEAARRGNPGNSGCGTSRRTTPPRQPPTLPSHPPTLGRRTRWMIRISRIG
jgi:hypothetical protein